MRSLPEKYRDPLCAGRFVCGIAKVAGLRSGGRGGARLLLLLQVVEPLGVGHGGARGDHANPGAMGGLGEVDGDTQAAGQGGEAGDVVLVLVGDEDGVERGGVFVGERPCA